MSDYLVIGLLGLMLLVGAVLGGFIVGAIAAHWPDDEA